MDLLVPLLLTLLTLTGCLSRSTSRERDVLELLYLEALIEFRLEDKQPVTTSEEVVSVQTELGVINGRTVMSPQGQEVEQFLGIPFAHPPVGDLRFADPVPLSTMPSDPYEATDYQNSCMQGMPKHGADFPGMKKLLPKNPLNEDCLYLNIWVPKTTTKKKQVVVWIYGGAFRAGSNSLWLYDGKALAAQSDMIVVNFNYRMGAFGFLSSGDGTIKGNFGMLDQVAAFQWVQDNIESFGGSSQDVTIFGHSCGGASISYHLLSSLSRDLFQRAWIQSGTADSHRNYMSPNEAQERFPVFADLLDCSETPDVLRCLRERDAGAILANQEVVHDYMLFAWLPTVDGNFMVDDPYHVMRSADLAAKDVVMGVTASEASFKMQSMLPGLDRASSGLTNYTHFLELFAAITFDIDIDDSLTLLDLYMPEDVTDEAANTKALVALSSDRSMICPSKEDGVVFAEQGLNVFHYYFTHRPSNEPWPAWMGVVHGSDVPFEFGVPIEKSRGYTAGEARFALTIMSYLSNFAKTGDPNGPGLPTWPLYHVAGRKDRFQEWRGASQFPTITDSLENRKRCDVWSDINEKYFEDLEQRTIT